MIAAIYSQLKPPERVLCVICGSKIALAEATTCFVVANRPAFACTTHLTKSQERAWFRGWLNFIVQLQVAALFAFAVRRLVEVAS